MGIFTYVAGTGNPVLRAVFRNRLSDRQNMLLTSYGALRPRWPEVPNFTACSVARFRLQYVVLRGQLSDVNQITLLRRPPARLLSVIFPPVISVRLINVFLLGRSPMVPLSPALPGA